ncbi:cyanophycin synthetase family protein [Tuwongella immobilis]|uniref:ATP-grasp domain-containing protein n=1 Tax=Tuwongella immobilis TaxID=692036 RepID=A0A6C2YPL7_9BACT|nr:Mur ligase family protein [Tuwongella immobilis]VIP02832.1 cyanophycin synthetase : Cyanphycin synthetase OS=Ralstonia sp. PBA GN=MW7_0632 PE=4 SV=1: RimK: Mur_ligase_M: Mur_ligase_C [Tuwongella immobilis]VTS02584.1 cyanophycin synthetase : Cyanphycin synthetase OS=Ralstonia sp. PBA GN=MW7_0632 PE=4 SV=1: RimK: Mur_ligase_M: Mur_ligase_C [Tuwongella immobilis]
MHFRKMMTLRGPNIWANYPVIEAWLDLEDLKDSPSDILDGFNERLMAWMPSMIEHRCSVGERGGFFVRLRRGTYQGHILEHIALELQTLAGSPVGFGRTRETYEEGVYKVVIAFENEELGKASLHAALRVCHAAVRNTPFNIQDEIDALTELAQRVLPTTTVRAMLKAAKARQIPVELLNQDGLMRFGWGVNQQRVYRTLSSRTATVAAELARDRESSLLALAGVGIPVPATEVVTTSEAAIRAADATGYPVVVRSRFGYSRQATFAQLTTPQQVADAFAKAQAVSREVLVEHQQVGSTWRCLVAGDRVVSVRVVAPSPSCPLPIDAEAIDQLSPEFASRIVLAAQTLGLDVAGVDVVAADLSQSLTSQHGLIVGVHPVPGLAKHLQPTHGTAQPVVEAVLDRIIPNGETGRIPLAAVTGVNGKTTTTRLLAHLVTQARFPTVGMTNTEGVYINQKRLESGDCSGPSSARKILHHPQMTAAVLETARGGILRAGLGFDRCDVAIVTNIGSGDHLGINDIHTVEELAKVKRCIIDVVHRETGFGILNAVDPLTVAMAEKCPGRVLFFAIDGENPVIVEHRAKGGRAAFVRDGMIHLAEGSHEIALIHLARVPLTLAGKIGFQVENVLAAAAGAWCLNLPMEAICHGLETFGNEDFASPGRFNVLNVDGATVILDYGHNISALERLIDALSQFPCSGQRHIVYSAAGDRRDEDMRIQGRMIADYFDRVVLYEDNYLRGRRPGEIIERFREGIAQSNRQPIVDGITGGVAAMQHALRHVQPGDVLLLQADVIDESVAFMRQFLSSKSVSLAASPTISMVELVAAITSAS